jgi:hypothetical protein
LAARETQRSRGNRLAFREIEVPYCIVKLRRIAFLFALSCALLPTLTSQQEGQARKRPKLLIAQCAEDGIEAVVPETTTRTKIADIDGVNGDIELQAAYSSKTEESGVIFWFVRTGKTIYSFRANDFLSYSIWLAFNPDDDRLALTYGTGESIGKFEVRVFQIDADKVTDLSTAVQPAVADFKSRHYCKARGNNVSALKWIGRDLLLMTEVYPTSDCGADLGHIEGYRVSVPDGIIQEHLTLEQLRHYPGVCLQNDDAQ